MLILGKACFRPKKIIRAKRHYIMIKRSILREDTTILYAYAFNNRATNYMRQKLIEVQEERGEYTI